MEGNSAIDDLLVGYILKELDAKDEAFVRSYITFSEENRLYFETLENTWKLSGAKEAFDKVDIDHEWNHFEQSVPGKQQRIIPVKKAVVPELYEDEKHGTPARYVRVLVSLAVAASLLLAIFLGWNYISNKPSLPAIAQQPGNKPATIVPVLKHETNTTRKKRKLILPDGSLVSLFQHSELSYKEPFAIGRRDVTLKGKADFKVAKDPSRPFTVFSLDLATTAIGTHFTVSAFAGAEKFNVRLYEGKIVVRSANLVRRTLKYDYYLLPGQELVYNNRNYSAKLVNFLERDRTIHGISHNETLVPEDPSVPENSKGSWYMFNNQKLGGVFDQLEMMYNADIIYSKKDVRNIYFIGKFEKTDSLYNILFQIASLNNLKVIRKKESYMIVK